MSCRPGTMHIFSFDSYAPSPHASHAHLFASSVVPPHSPSAQFLIPAPFGTLLAPRVQTLRFKFRCSGQFRVGTASRPFQPPPSAPASMQSDRQCPKAETSLLKLRGEGLGMSIVEGSGGERGLDGWVANLSEEGSVCAAVQASVRSHFECCVLDL
eukprot:2621140-Pleurochrysis_carterae.AAC.1